MWDMISYIRNALPGDHIILKGKIAQEGYIISKGTLLYFVLLDIDKENVRAALDKDLKKTFTISLRSIDKIMRDKLIIYSSDPRDIVYGR